MNQEDIETMPEEAFTALIDNYIERTSRSYGEMPASTFFELLFERMSRQVEETINLSVKLVDDHLVIHPQHESEDILVQGNQIFIGNRRLVLNLTRSA